MYQIWWKKGKSQYIDLKCWGEGIKEVLGDQGESRQKILVTVLEAFEASVPGKSKKKRAQDEMDQDIIRKFRWNMYTWRGLRG